MLLKIDDLVLKKAELEDLQVWRLDMNFEKLNDADVRLEGNQMIMRAQKGTNLFNGVTGMWKCVTFPYYYTKVQGDFLVRCAISVDFESLYDLGALVIYENEDRWMKFAYENSDAGAPSIVTVVTEKTSDDCNGESISDNKVWLQICRQGNVFAMHYSVDKQNWKLARICRSEMSDEVMVGISTQCPVGENCTAYYSDFEITENPFSDIRNLKRR